MSVTTKFVFSCSHFVEVTHTTQEGFFIPGEVQSLKGKCQSCVLKDKRIAAAFEAGWVSYHRLRRLREFGWTLEQLGIFEELSVREANGGVLTRFERTQLEASLRLAEALREEEQRLGRVESGTNDSWWAKGN